MGCSWTTESAPRLFDFTYNRQISKFAMQLQIKNFSCFTEAVSTTVTRGFRSLLERCLGLTEDVILKTRFTLATLQHGNNVIKEITVFFILRVYALSLCPQLQLTHTPAQMPKPP